MNEREYLISKGLAKPGRGRFSNAAKAELERARAGGMKIGASQSAPSDTAVVEVPPYTWPNHKAVTLDGEEVSMANACLNCPTSLYWCECGKPQALASRGGYQEVRFVEVH